ncbi:Ferric iron ABC transporter, iron-binding protein [Candidatus Phaeomarinobacter ectocarpi]|uniref:Ferric iron ABC transporter, iron-binding protein n=1 Tax=Candidatus Phaeomarinibacter ectocarpi TaxID=1458461 RepID=X5MG23_9HYPH|nr:Fe(3+) ABC transporter substrate-binding protein [Candidatus Phaeomarinobacter ectocarpi]CDO60329.1 Ferric iron ABC transporter, iron-binding protein [Candidatus Phaeomarinobacter ectocarpi]
MRLLVAAAAAVIAFPLAAQAAGEVNIYSSRHYDTDERLYSDFEEATGITVNRIEDKANVLIERIKAEGENSPADILLTVDAGRLYQADQAGIFQSIDSDTLDDRIPENLRHPDGHWFGFSTRGRAIFYDKAKVDPADIQTYASLADPKLKGLVCTRSSSNIYMLSLLAAVVEHEGEENAKTWVEGLWANRARDPEGGDTDQLRAIASGQCAIAVANTYYFARALSQDVRDLANPDDTDRIGIVFPDQPTEDNDANGTHVNVSAGGVVANAPNRANAIAFLEYLATDAAQKYFADGNNEYPVVEGVEASSAVESLGAFEADDLPLIKLGENQATAQKIYNEVGYQ